MGEGDEDERKTAFSTCMSIGTCTYRIVLKRMKEDDEALYMYITNALECQR